MNNNNKVESTSELPSGYDVYKVNDLKTNKGIALAIQIIFLIIAGLMIFIAIYFKLPISSDLPVILKIIIPVSLVLIYMVLHELTHGLFIWLISKQRPSFGLRFPYLITGSKHYYNKCHFIMILLAPAIIWGTILIIVLLVLPNSLFMSLYIVTGINFASSAGDYVQAFMIKDLAKDVLIKDDGINTTYYTKQ